MSDNNLNLSKADLIGLIRAIVRQTKAQTLREARTPKIISGSVEDVNDEELNVAWIRMDQEASGADPTQSDNYGEPGVIPAKRIGSTYRNEQTRVTFDGPAGANAVQTGAEKRIMLPFGAEHGQRVLLEGDDGVIYFFNEDGDLVGILDGKQWAIGRLDPESRRITIDAFGGVRMHDNNDNLTTIFDQNGLALRSPDTGMITAEMQGGSFRLVDPEGTDDIEMTTATGGTFSMPTYRGRGESSPGSGLLIPAAPQFTFNPANDISVGHVVAWRRATSQAATMTEPSGWTEEVDTVSNDDAGSMHISVASNHPSDGDSGEFTSSQSNWENYVGTHVIVRGIEDDSPTPSVRSSATNAEFTSSSTYTSSILKPAGVEEGDILLTFVSLGVSGGFVPTGWETPAGFVLLGAEFSTSGSGSTQSTAASGVWAKLAGPSEPAEYSTSINLPAGLKTIQGTMVAIKDGYLVPGGVQIRMAGRPIRRLLARNELQSTSSQLCDFDDISQGYDNLELIYSGNTSTGSGGNDRLRMRFNGVDSNTYRYKQARFGTSLTLTDNAHTFFRIGGLGSVNGSRTTGSCNIYRYASVSRAPTILAEGFWQSGSDFISETDRGFWTVQDPVTRITVDSDGDHNFAAGTQVFLYGY